MKCPNCHRSFKFSDVPLENRSFQAFGAIFLCIYCQVVLTPNRTYKLFMNIGLLVILAGVCVILFSSMGIKIPSGLILLGLSLCFYGHKTMEVIIYNEEEL